MSSLGSILIYDLLNLIYFWFMISLHSRSSVNPSLRSVVDLLPPIPIHIWDLGSILCFMISSLLTFWPLFSDLRSDIISQILSSYSYYVLLPQFCPLHPDSDIRYPQTFLCFMILLISSFWSALWSLHFSSSRFDPSFDLWSEILSLIWSAWRSLATVMPSSFQLRYRYPQSFVCFMILNLFILV